MTDSESQEEAQPPAGGGRLTITISGCPQGLAPSIRAAARRALRSQAVPGGRLDIAVVGDAEMRRQHARWLGDDSPTDVLTFDLRESTDRGAVDGQLLVCRSVARRRARSRRTDWRAELLLYVVHGCLHLCGYADRDEAGAARMHAEEDRILRALGWGPVYADRGTRTAKGDRRAVGKRGGGSCESP